MTRAFTKWLLPAMMLLVVACGDSSLTVTNSSSFAITQLHLTPATSSSWGPDLLAGDTLFPGESVTITGIDCDDYDVQLIDEDGDACVLSNIELCLDDAAWVIDDAALFACTLF